MMFISLFGMVTITYIVKDRDLPMRSPIDEPWHQDPSSGKTEKSGADFRFVPSAVRDGS